MANKRYWKRVEKIHILSSQFQKEAIEDVKKK